METRICQAGKVEFTISDNEIAFCEKMKVPLPTFSPFDRFRRRLMRRNERVLNIRTCSGTGKKIVSVYDEKVTFPVYSREYWYSDKWDGTDYGRDYDFDRNFFDQYIELSKVAPRMSMWQVNTTNSDYSNYIVDSKNCYLCFTALGNNEDCMYSSYITGNVNCLDCDHCTKCERCYECFNCDTSYNLKYSVDSTNCRDSFFLRDCNNCSDCFGCVALKDKQYHIFNEPYSKEDYEKKVKEFKITSRQNILHIEEKVNKLWKSYPRKYLHGKKNERVTGDYINNSGKCTNAFFSNNCEDNINTFFTIGLKNSMDITVSPVNNEFLYECHAVPRQNSYIKFSDLCANGSTNLEYCSNLDTCSNCFGCIGLRHKEYCILNKQYSKEDYESVVEKIKKQMIEMPYKDRGGRIYKYGEFFPPEASPFAYNESMAQEHFPLSKQDAEKQGYAWKDLKERDYAPTLTAYEIPSEASEIPDDIGKEILGCMNEGSGDHNCQTAFRILPNELIFYRQNNIPLPKHCPNCRHNQRLEYRNQLVLHEEKCNCAGAQSSNGSYKNNIKHPHHGIDQCQNSFQTTYNDKSLIVYCEDCYKQEVY